MLYFKLYQLKFCFNNDIKKKELERYYQNYQN